MRVYIQRYNTFFTTTATGPHGISAHRRFWSAPHSPSSEINNNNNNKFPAVLWIRIREMVSLDPDYPKKQKK
jgi:hypothetical protein